MAGSRIVLGLLLLSTLLVAGCTDSGTLITSHTRANTDDESFDHFTFHVAEGTKRLQIRVSTQGEPESGGSVRIHVESETEDDDGGDVYSRTLGHGQSDEQIIENPPPGGYDAILLYQDYTGPANMEIIALGGAAAAPGGLGLAENFWEILGIVLTLAVAAGGWFLFRHHSKRLDREMTRIDQTFHELCDDTSNCRKTLLQLQDEFQRQLVKSRLKEAHFLILEKRIERYLQDLKERRTNGGSFESPLELE